VSARFTRGEKVAGGVFVVFWILGVLLSLAVTGVVVWGIIELVQWVTAQ